MTGGSSHSAPKLYKDRRERDSDARASAIANVIARRFDVYVTVYINEFDPRCSGCKSAGERA